ncbi:MAG: aconitase X swivel domain-containing protein [Candidatus Thorarchaeota archaeon]|jgi:predicted aconitase with swiveling domain
MKLSRILCNPLLSGVASGPALVTSQPICFWGGLDPKTGIITERDHELKGQNVAGTVFVFPTGKGSSTTSAILLESVRCGTAPAAIVNLKTEPILVIGALIAEKLYDCAIPIVDTPERDPIKVINSGDWVEVNASETQGWIQIRE